MNPFMPEVVRISIFANISKERTPSTSYTYADLTMCACSRPLYEKTTLQKHLLRTSLCKPGKFVYIFHTNHETLQCEAIFTSFPIRSQLEALPRSQMSSQEIKLMDSTYFAFPKMRSSYNISVTIRKRYRWNCE